MLTRRLLLAGAVLLLIGFTSVNAQVTENAIILDNVDAPFVGQDSVFLNCGGELVFNLRIEVKEVEGTIGGVSNGFHVYEADPGDPTVPIAGTARWDNISATYLNDAWNGTVFGLIVVPNTHLGGTDNGVPPASVATGMGADTVRFVTTGVGTGIEVPSGGYSSVDWQISVDLVPDAAANGGKTICLDSTETFCPGCNWVWQTPFGAMTENPTFSGPHCYTMVWSPIFSCGNVDCDLDMQVDLADIIFLVNYLFLGGPEPAQLPWADVNCDGEYDIADAIYLANSLFLGGPAPCADC